MLRSEHYIHMNGHSWMLHFIIRASTIVGVMLRFFKCSMSLAAGQLSVHCEGCDGDYCNNRCRADVPSSLWECASVSVGKRELGLTN